MIKKFRTWRENRRIAKYAYAPGEGPTERDIEDLRELGYGEDTIDLLLHPEKGPHGLARLATYDARYR